MRHVLDAGQPRPAPDVLVRISDMGGDPARPGDDDDDQEAPETPTDEPPPVPIQDPPPSEVGLPPYVVRAASPAKPRQAVFLDRQISILDFVHAAAEGQDAGRAGRSSI